MLLGCYDVKNNATCSSHGDDRVAQKMQKENVQKSMIDEWHFD
jgi:hypothetical protein